MDNESPRTTPPKLDKSILGISTAGLKDPTNNLANSATVDNKTNGWEDKKV